MLTTILSIILFLIFSVLSGFHFYWFFGGKWGLSKAIPTKGTESVLPSLPRIATLIVALGLLAFGLSYLLKSELITLQLPQALMAFSYWFIPIIFLLRAMGEFNYVGLFRKIKNTEFAKADRQLFTPLCLVIGIAGILIQVMS